MEPLVTVITATKNIIENGKANDFALLCTLLELQSFPRIEHLVVDGDSTDGTVALLEDYKSKGLLNYISTPDISKFDAYNKGLKIAKGKYVTFLSADDFYHDITIFEDIVNQMEIENAAFTFSPSYCRHPLGTVFMFMPSFHNAFQVVPCPRQCMVFRKTFLQIEQGFDTKFKYMADFDLIIRFIMKKYKALYIHRNFVTYKLGINLYQSPELGEFEAKEIFKKNYGQLCKLSDETLNDMVKLSAFPQELLDKLVRKFPDEDREIFYERCEQMRLLRTTEYLKDHPDEAEAILKKSETNKDNSVTGDNDVVSNDSNNNSSDNRDNVIDLVKNAELLNNKDNNDEIDVIFDIDNIEKMNNDENNNNN